MRDLGELRAEIDAIDPQILALFERRMAITGEVADWKRETGRPILDPVREEEKLKAIAAAVRDRENLAGARELFRQIMAIGRKRQYQRLSDGSMPFSGVEVVDALPVSGARIVYQGLPGAYTHQAARQFFGDHADTIPVANWREAMRAVASGEAAYGVFPIENSTAGVIVDIYDHLLEYAVYIVGEVTLAVDHCLLALPDTDLEQIRTICSHPQAIAQCASYLELHEDWKTLEVLNTAFAAEKVAHDADPSVAAIASAEAAETYGLKILHRGLSTDENCTRFIVISGEPRFRGDAGKISICFGLPHTCGSLYDLLSHFFFNELNLVKIESRPVPEQPFSYRFFIDFEGNLFQPSVRNALQGVFAEASDGRILGNY